MAFPLTVTIQWTANPPAENVTGYSVSVNGTPVGDTVGTSMPYVLTGPGTYVASVVAHNAFGDSPAGQATLVAGLPSQPTNVTFLVP